MNNKIPTLFLIVFGLLLTALLSRNGDLAWMALPFLVYLGMGILQTPAAEKVLVHAVRSIEKNKVDGLTSIQVSVTVSNQGASIGQLCLFDPLQDGMTITDGRRQHTLVLDAGEDALLRYTFRSERGSFSWEVIQAVISDPFGLVERRLRLPASAKVQVQPEIRKFRPFPLRLRRTLHSSGSIPARLGGSGTDFWSVREYHPGDPLRRLDWRLTARHPRQFFTKEFEQEEIADIGLILDARKKTNLCMGEDSLFEHSIRATASLAELFLGQGNRVSLLTTGQPGIHLYPGYGKIQLSRILQALAQASTESSRSLNSLDAISVRMFASHSLILILSPLAPHDWRLFSCLRAHGYQVLLISPDPFDCAQRRLSSDPATRLSGRLAQVERQLEIRKIAQLWIPVIDWQVSQPLAPLVRDALSHLHIQRQR